MKLIKLALTLWPAWILVALIPLAACVAGGEGYGDTSVKLDAKYLAEHEDAYLGKQILVHACLVVTAHGAYIYPCGSWTSKYVISLDPSAATAGLVADTFFKRLHTDFGSQVEADVIGRLIRRKMISGLGKSRVIPVLKLQQIQNPVVYKP